MKFNGIWVGWGTEQPSGIDPNTYLTVMTTRPDSELDMSKLSTMPLPDANPKLLNIGGVWEGGQENNWSAFFTQYGVGQQLKMILAARGFTGIVLDLETAIGTEPDINVGELKSFIVNCKNLGFYCLVTCLSGDTARYVETLADTGVDGVIPMLYNGSWTDLYTTNWKNAAAATGANLVAGIAYKYEEHYTFLADVPSPGGVFVWGVGSGGGNATGAQCQQLIDQYQNNTA